MADSNNLILIAVGPDNVGLIQKISEFIVRSGGNIEDSRMAVLQGEFAIILLVSGEKASLKEIARSVEQLGSETGLTIYVKEPSGKKSPEPALPYRLVASCMDHPGVVHRLSATLSGRGINIESMETQTYAAPVSGTPIFRMEAFISVPAKTSMNALRSALSEIEREENIDIDLTLATDSQSGSR